MYHHEGEKATAQAAEKFGTFFSLSTMGTTSIEEDQTRRVDQKCFSYIFIKIKA